MAEDEKKKEDAKEGKKKGLPPLVLVAVGAALGGAGVVFMAPKQEQVQDEPRPSVPEIIDCMVEDPIEHNFNPRTDRGRSAATFSFKFSYRVSKDNAEEAEALREKNWDLMKSKVLLLFMQHTPEELTDTKENIHLEKLMRETMTLSLFPPEEGGESGIAVVKDILWKKRLVQ